MERIHIIGAGLAGLSAAIELAKRDIGVSLISSMPSERAQSVLAEGGINAALDLMDEGDAPAAHAADTLRGGCDLADPNAVAGLTGAAPDIARWLLSLGVPFQREGGRVAQRFFGGQSARRALYCQSGTGKAVMSALIDEARRYEAAGLIIRYPHHEFVRLMVEDGRCAGAIVRDAWTGQGLRFAGPVILATGGLNGLFPGQSTGTTLNTGGAAAEVFSQGVAFANLEFIQYHPTTVSIPGKRLLVSEAARAEGGRLFTERDGARWYFMEQLHPERGNLAPRDVISREMARLSGPVYLDLTGIPNYVWRACLPDLREELRRRLALDPAKTPVPVRPGIHFFMGGVAVDEYHRTNMPSLYAAGECACQYHGANRLGGNSMLGAIYGGRVAASTAAETGGTPEPPRPVSLPPEEPAQDVSAALAGLGVLRDEAGMTAALEEVSSLPDGARTRLARAMLLSALARRESRGAHTRTDFPERDDARYRKTTVAAYRDGEITITFEEIPDRRQADAH